jgi:ApbE superfamily uncharacterized protein (UPF0280 family)
VYEPRVYRERMWAKGLVSFQVVVKETDLHISADKNLKKEAQEAVQRHRRDIEDFISSHPIFGTTFTPYKVPDSVPPIVKSMAEAAEIAGVGPMAAVAGAIAEYVGRDLLNYSKEIVVENGGDIFIRTAEPRKIGIFAGKSPLSEKIALTVYPEQTPLGICTSSGTVGPSVSFGKADAVVILSPNTSQADAAATVVGNIIQTEKDIQKGIARAREISGIVGAIIIKGEKIGLWGDLEVVPL